MIMKCTYAFSLFAHCMKCIPATMANIEQMKRIDVVVVYIVLLRCRQITQ